MLGYITGYAYDKNNRLANIMDKEGKTTQYSYDPAGHLISIKHPESTATYNYDAKGKELTRSLIL